MMATDKSLKALADGTTEELRALAEQLSRIRGELSCSRGNAATMQVELNITMAMFNAKIRVADLLFEAAK